MFDSLLTFAHGVTKMDFKRAFSEQNNVSCKHEQVGWAQYSTLNIIYHILGLELWIFFL